MQLEVKARLGSMYTQGNISFLHTQSSLLCPSGNSLSLIDLETNVSRTLSLSLSHEITLCAVDPSDEIVAIGDSEGRVHLFGLSAGVLLGSKKMKEFPTKLEFSHNGALLAVAAGRRIELFERPRRADSPLLEPFLLLKRHNFAAEVNGFRFSSDDRALLVCGADGVTRAAVTLPEGGDTSSLELGGHKSRVVDVLDRLEEEASLATLDKNGLLLVWKIEERDSDEPAGPLKKRTKKTTSSTEAGSPAAPGGVEVSAVERLLVSGKAVLISKRLLFKEGQSIESALFGRSELAVLFSDGSVAVHSVGPLSSPDPLTAVVSVRIESGPGILALSPLRPLLAVGVHSNFSELAVFDYRAKSFSLRQTCVSGSATCAAFGPRGLVAVGDGEGGVRLFDARSQLSFVTFQHAVGRITGLVFIDSTTLAASALDGRVRLYDLRKFRMFRELAADPPAQILALAAGGDSIFASTSAPFGITVFSPRTGETLRVLTGHTGPVHLLVYLPASGLLASAAWDRCVRTCLPFGKTTAAESFNVGAPVADLKASRDERRLFVATAGGEVQVLDPATAALIAVLNARPLIGPRGSPRIAAGFDGARVLVAGPDRLVFFDVAHRAPVKAIRLPARPDFRNSSLIRDGIDTAALERSASAANKRDPRLPGSADPRFADPANLPPARLDALEFAPDGSLLLAVTHDGVLLLQPRLPPARAAPRPASKPQLLAAASEHRFLDFALMALDLSLAPPLKTVLSRLTPGEARSLALAASPRQLPLLARCLSESLAESREIGALILVAEQFLLARVSELATPELAHLPRQIEGAIQLRLHDFCDIAETAKATTEFILAQSKTQGIEN